MTKAGQSGVRPSTLFAAGHDDRDDQSLSEPKSGQDSPRGRKAPPKPELTGQISNKLRSVYNEVLSQPVPDRFLDLLKQLDTAVAAKESK